ncbi:MAG TPA: amidase, partial [Gemmatimonadales bacterium]|nr:amidase [Gemmatimonadales bacterium]
LYSERIRELDRTGLTLRHVLEVNPDAARIAADLDAERKAGKIRGPLHGIPVVLKDNIDTGDQMSTSAGSLALEGSAAPKDSPLAARLREAGAILLAKTSMSEWANFRSSHSSSGWCSRGGQGKNPYALDRSPCGSSSGTGGAIAASYAAAGIGTETDGSITCPSSIAALVGIKPTVGLVSRTGIIPISHTQDTAGPMARTVADAALVLTTIAGPDPTDPATRGAPAGSVDYLSALDPDALRGARLGVCRKHFTGYHDGTDRVFAEALDAMRQLGAIIVDPADLPHAGEYDDAEFTVLLYEFKADLNAYFAGRGASSPMKSLKDVMIFNEKERQRVMPYFGQELMQQAEAKGPLTEKAYKDALAKCRLLSRTRGIDAIMQRHQLDALVAPTGNPAWPIDLVNGDHFTGSVTTPAAVAGYPHITVPAGFDHGLPVGLSFFGRGWSEARLIGLAYSYEQGTRHRRPPTYAPSIDLGAGLEGSVGSRS